MNDIEVLRKEIEKLKAEIEWLKERERVRDLEARDGLLIIIRGIEKRHKIGKYADLGPISVPAFREQV